MIIDRWNDISHTAAHNTLEELDDEINYDYGYRLCTIPQRDPEERTMDPINWLPLVGRVRWKIDEIATLHGGSVLGQTMLERGHRNRRTIVTLSYLLLEPLLRTGFKKLTQSERLVQQFFITSVLYHEMAVGFQSHTIEVPVNVREACILDDVLTTRSFQCCFRSQNCKAN